MADSMEVPVLARESRLKGALFVRPASEEPEVTNAPVMTGFLDGPAGRIQVAAFRKTSLNTRRIYLSLKIGDPHSSYLYGRLFSQAQAPAQTQAGKESPDYTGFVNLVGDDRGHQLRIVGWTVVGRRQTYVALLVEPRPERHLNPLSEVSSIGAALEATDASST